MWYTVCQKSKLTNHITMILIVSCIVHNTCMEEMMQFFVFHDLLTFIMFRTDKIPCISCTPSVHIFYNLYLYPEI